MHIYAYINAYVYASARRSLAQPFVLWDTSPGHVWGCPRISKAQVNPVLTHRHVALFSFSVVHFFPRLPLFVALARQLVDSNTKRKSGLGA